MTQYFYLIRGLPGSGKSTLAKTIAASIGGQHFEADQYFVDENGIYHFDRNFLSTAHLNCFDNTEAALRRSQSVVVSNTFTTQSEMDAYFQLGVKLNIKPCVITAQGNYENVHGVPSQVLHHMRARFDHRAPENLYRKYFQA